MVRGTHNADLLLLIFRKSHDFYVPKIRCYPLFRLAVLFWQLDSNHHVVAILIAEIIEIDKISSGWIIDDVIRNKQHTHECEQECYNSIETNKK